jgi:hypothetical protein
MIRVAFGLIILIGAIGDVKNKPKVEYASMIGLAILTIVYLAYRNIVG